MPNLLVPEAFFLLGEGVMLCKRIKAILAEQGSRFCVLE